MDKEHHQEFTELENKARLRLRTGVDRHGYRRELQALIFPSFEDCCAYEFLSATRSSGEPAFVVRTIWRRTTDLSKFRNPIVRLRYGSGVEPTFEESSVELPENDLKTLLAPAASLRVPPLAVNAHWGVDGTSYELTFGNGFAGSRFHWWTSPPEGWEPLQELVEHIGKVVNRNIDSKMREIYRIE